MIAINKRLLARHRIHNDAEVLLPAGYVDAKVLDISMTGALIEVGDLNRVPRGAACSLRLLPDSGRQLLEVETKVVRLAGDRRIGLKICNLSRGAHGALLRLIESAAHHHRTSQREVCALLRRVDAVHLASANTTLADTTTARCSV